ncbi:MAG: M15 family metallopeptidase [Roseburia sp.]|nr:M15 family metallopeptidase [Roseburia sp.]MCM1098148.1 M15 family metallopeptidase [Ruminococcus flavefaciens]
MLEIHGWNDIVPVSGWRSLAEQQRIWDDSLRDNGPEFTRKYVAQPGHSEHHTGLAIDLGLKSDQIDFIRPAFPDSGVCRLFREKAAKYGFILRYPAGKESITGISHEPWHFRYVGVPHAGIMAENGLTLEEYIAFIRRYPYSHPLRYQTGQRRIAVSWRKCDGEQTVMEIPAAHPYTLSGNNVDGFILAEWSQ